VSEATFASIRGERFQPITGDRPRQAGRPIEYYRGKRTGRTDVTGAEWSNRAAEFWIHLICGDSPIINCTNNNEIYSFHPTGANFLYGDGSVHFHPETIDSDTFISLFTRAAGDTVP